MRLFDRDREAAGAMVGSAIAFRLFLFFVPMVLFVVGLAGFIGAHAGEEALDDARITGSLALQINEALNQPNSTRLIATILGLLGMLMGGRRLSQTLAVASCLAWRLPVKAKVSFRVLGACIGLVVTVGLLSALTNRLRHDAGLSVAVLSLVAASAVYAAAWLVLTLWLPRDTPDPGALLPGAVLVGVTLALLQAISQLYLPRQFSNASELYGAIGAAVVTLGWFFTVGRVLVFAVTLNAVMYERFGSVTAMALRLPVLRAIPRRWPSIGRVVDLSDPGDAAANDTNGADDAAP